MAFKLSKLIESEFEEIIDFRGHQIFLVIRPDVYVSADKLRLDDAVQGNDVDAVFGYVAKGLADWGVIVGDERHEITDDKGKKIAITAESLKATIPESFVMQVADKIESLKRSTVGKPTPRGKSASSSAV